MVSEDLETLIQRYIILGKPSPQGFHGVKCAVCNDHKVRGGFKFDGGSVGFNCFNCGIKAAQHDDARSLSSKMKEVLVAFGIPEAELQATIAARFFKEGDAKPEAVKVKPALALPMQSLTLPDGSAKITSDDNPWCEVARTYLADRGLDPTAYPYHATDRGGYEGRVIIPYYFRDRLIYWQGRSLDPSIEPRYKNPTIEKENLFFNMDELYRYTDEPLFVTEGPLDALSLGPNAVATLGSTLSELRERELVRVASRRRVIFAIDKNPNGYKLGQKVLRRDDLPWYVACFPDNVEDANEALRQFGRLWAVSFLAGSAAKGLAGELMLKIRCKT